MIVSVDGPTPLPNYTTPTPIERTEAKVRDPSVDIATAPETQALVKLIASEGMG